MTYSSVGCVMLAAPLLSGQHEDHDGSEPRLSSVLVRQRDIKTNPLSHSLSLTPTPVLVLTSCLPSLTAPHCHTVTLDCHTGRYSVSYSIIDLFQS